jgi:large subunit ribosomal protein L25
MTNLAIEKREAGKGVDTLRASGRIPAVMYGPKFASTSISMSATDFEKAFREAGESTVITLAGNDITEDTLVHEVEYHPVSGVPLHVDFYVIEKGKKVQVAVPLEFVGESSAVKNGADLIKVMHEVEVEAMPKDLPHNIEVDISVLATNDAQIHAKDLPIPSGVTLITDADEVIALVAVHEEEKEEVVEAFDPTKIEVEEKGKKDEEGEEGAEPAKAE